jgi:hypothetical protein
MEETFYNKVVTKRCDEVMRMGAVATGLLLITSGFSIAVSWWISGSMTPFEIEPRGQNASVSYCSNYPYPSYAKLLCNGRYIQIPSQNCNTTGPFIEVYTNACGGYNPVWLWLVVFLSAFAATSGYLWCVRKTNPFISVYVLVIVAIVVIRAALQLIIEAIKIVYNSILWALFPCYEKINEEIAAHKGYAPVNDL